MARKSSRSKRIEPKFDDGSDLRVSAKERVGSAKAPRNKKSKKTKKSPAKKPSLFWRFCKFIFRPAPKLAYWGLVFGLWAFIAVAGIVGYFAAQLPSADTWHVPDRPPNMRILAAGGELIGNRGLTGGKNLRLEEISPYIPQAVIAIEDRRFHAHFGFDPIGFTRAMATNLVSGRLRQGGSTLTQQLAKNLFLKPERTMGRKVQELILAFWLEAKYSKVEILELYLNRVYFGAGATGVDAAALRYFGKSAKHVNVGEAALLAGLLKAPSRYTPARNPKLAQARAKVVLRAMQREGYIKPGKIDYSAVEPTEHARHFRSGSEHFVADMVAKEVRKLVGKNRGDVVVQTTFNQALMQASHMVLSQQLDAHVKSKNVRQAALVSMAPDGALRTIVGGRDYAKSQFNRAVEARRQPGSAFKPFVFLNALERGHGPDTVMEDAPLNTGKWRPTNYDNRFRGPVTLRTALSKSINTIAAKLTLEAGPRNVAHTAGRMGINSPLKANASLALGTSEVSLLELTAAYAPFANGGLFARPYMINKITDADGKVLYKRKKDVPVRVVESRELAMMNVMLKDVVDRGTGRKARLKNFPTGGKTGTSQKSRDALFVGYTAEYVTGVWFGNDDNSPTKKLTGGTLPAQVWHDYMEFAHSGLKPKPLPGASDLIAALPAKIPYPTYRPNRETAAARDLKQRVTAAIRRDKPRRTLIDIILGRE